MRAFEEELRLAGDVPQPSRPLPSIFGVDSGGQSVSPDILDSDDEEVINMIRGMDMFDEDPTGGLFMGGSLSIAPTVSLGPRCSRCHNPCGDDVVFYESLAFHRRHFRCRQCGGPLTEPKIILEDLYCGRCAAQFKDNETNPIEDNQDTRVICETCKEIINGKVISVFGAHFHPDCFLCFRCHKKLAEKAYTSWRGKPICTACYALLPKTEHVPHQGPASEVTTRRRPLFRHF